MKTEPATLIGLDLGAFKTTAVALNGRSVTFRSCAGSTSGSRISESDAIVGADWPELRHLVEPFAGGRFKFLNPPCPEEITADCLAAARCLVRHAVSRVVPNAAGPVLGVVPVPARASDFNRKFLQDATAGILDGCVLVPSPVATAYGAGQIGRTLVVDVGAGTIDMAVFDSAGELPGPNDLMTLPIGLGCTDQQFAELVTARHSKDLTLDLARQLRERFGRARGEVTQAVVRCASGDVVCVSDCLMEACRSLVNSMTTALQELSQSGCQRPETVILTGGGSQMRDLASVISNLIPGTELLIPCAVSECEAQGALAMARDLPEDFWRELQRTGSICETVRFRAQVA